MNTDLAGKCQGAIHCGSLSAWSGNDTIVAVTVMVLIVVVVTLFRR